MKTFLYSALLMFVLGLSGCGGDSDSTPSTDTAINAPVAAEESSADVLEEDESIHSKLSLNVDGVEKSFSYFPDDKNLTMSLSTMILAKPSPEATEEFSMAVMGFDLVSAELPVTLQLGLREAMQSENPAQFASNPKPLISYIAPEGSDYTSYATVVFEQYQDGIATGRVEDIQLEPADGDGRTIMLSDIRFEVAL